MKIDKDTHLRNFHQAKWDEEVIFQLHTPGERGMIVSEADKEIRKEIGDGFSSIPQK